MFDGIALHYAAYSSSVFVGMVLVTYKASIDAKDGGETKLRNNYPQGVCGCIQSRGSVCQCRRDENDRCVIVVCV